MGIQEKPVANRFFELWRNLKKSNEVLEKPLQVQTVQKQVIWTFEKCFARPSSHSKIGIFQLFCWNVWTLLDIIPDRSAYAALSLWWFATVKPAILGEWANANQIMKIDKATLIKKLIKRTISRRLIWNNFLKKLNLLWQPYWNFFRRYLFFSIWVFFHEHSQITWMQGKWEGISLTPHHNFYLLRRHLDINQALTAGRSPLLLASSQTRTRNLWFPSASC